jgi:hypothetical protein
MLNSYYSASSIKGTVAFGQSSEGIKVQILTSVQRDAPNLFFLEQTRVPKSDAPEAKNYFVAKCDGKRMGYTLPKGFLPATSGRSSTFYENAPKTSAEGLDAFAQMLSDRSLPIAIAIYNSYEVKRVTDRLANLKVADGNAEYKGKAVYRVSAEQVRVVKNRPPIRMPVTIVIDKEFNLLFIGWDEVVANEGASVNVRSEWTVNLQVNPTGLDKNLYTVR